MQGNKVQLLKNTRADTMQQERNHINNDQSNADCNKRRKGQITCNFVGKMIGAIIASSACGCTRKSQEMCLNTKEEKERPIAKEHHQLALNKTHPCEEIQDIKNCKKQSAKGRLIISSSLSGIFTKAVKSINGTKDSSLKPEVGLKRGMKRSHEEEEANIELELCKKRILMGGKCSPLNTSGVLHYDEQGILLPEDVFPS